MKKTALALAIIVAMLLSAVTGIEFVKQVNARIMTVPDDFSTIQGAIDAANNGDTVFVKSGYYPETLIVNKSLTLIGQDKEHTIIDAQKTYSTVVKITADGVTFTNFTLGNTKYPTSSGGPYNTGITLQNTSNANIVKNTIVSSGSGVYFGFGVVRNSIIEDNLFVDCFAIDIVKFKYVVEDSIIVFRDAQIVDYLETYNVTIRGNHVANLTDISYSFPSPSLEPTSTPLPTPTPSPEPTTPTSPTPLPSEEPQQTEQEIIIGVAIAVAVLGAGLGLLIYLIKKK